MAVVIAVAFGIVAPAVELPDSSTYLGAARSWARGEGLMEAPGQPLQYRLPLYPLALGAVIRVFGDSLRAMALANVAFHLGSMLLARAIVARRDRVVADWACALALVYPPFLTATATVLQETLLALAIALFAWALTRAADGERVLPAFGAGAALGLAALGKVVALPLAFPAALLVAFVPRRSPARAAALLLGAACVLMPWAVRNHAVLGRLEVTNNNGGHTLFGGTVSNEIDDWYGFPEYVAAVERWRSAGEVAEPVLDRYLYAAAIERIEADPVRWLRLVGARGLRFMLPSRQWMAAVGWSKPGTVTPGFIAGAVLQVALFVATALLAWTAWRTRQPWGMWIGPAIVFWHLAVYAVAYVSPRYNITVGPLLMSSAALLVAARRSSTRASIGTRGGPSAPGR
jgi:4-amino-4-deoxy-L-arabinose transferase-like glycosyltransferase